MKLHKLFTKYVIKTFLTEDKKGEYVALVIDEQFMESAANELKLTLDKLIIGLRTELYSADYNTSLNLDLALTIISLQLYAASKCETDEEYSANAYNPRLCEIMDCNSSSLWHWYQKNQEKIWTVFYKWCRNNNFSIQECRTRNYKNKYVQYPLELAKYLLNREDLKYVASIFNKYKLEPTENIFYSDFWRILDIRLDFRGLTNHIQKVFDAVYKDTNCYDIVQSQIYNHYIIWDNKYIDPYKQRTERLSLKEKYKLHLSDKNKNYKIDIRKDDGSRVNCFQIESISTQQIKNYYSFKRKGVIIFQMCDNGDLNYWDETRLIEDKNTSGIAILFNNSLRNKFYEANVLFYSQDITLYKFKYNHLTKEFYSNGEKAYALLDGLKVSRNTYLLEGRPIWRIYNDCEYLVNGKAHSITKGDHILDLPVGEHILKFPKSRDIKITIIPPSKRTIEWPNKQTWEVNKKNKIWGPSIIKTGIIGLNFGFYSKTSNSKSALQTWIKLNQSKKIKPKSNTTSKQLKSINKYE